MGNYTVKDNAGSFGASYLIDSHGQTVVDPTFYQEYFSNSGEKLIYSNGPAYTYYDLNGQQVNNTSSYMIAPDHLASASGFVSAVQTAANLPNATLDQKFGLLAAYKLETNPYINLNTGIPDEASGTFQSYVLFGAGNPQLNPTGTEFLNQIIRPFTGIGSYLFGAIAAVRSDGLQEIEEAGFFNTLVGGKNTLGFDGNSERNTVLDLAGIQGVENGRFNDLTEAGNFPFAWSIGLNPQSATAYFNALRNGNTMDSSSLFAAPFGSLPQLNQDSSGVLDFTGTSQIGGSIYDPALGATTSSPYGTLDGVATAIAGISGYSLSNSFSNYPLGGFDDNGFSGGAASIIDQRNRARTLSAKPESLQHEQPRKIAFHDFSHDARYGQFLGPCTWRQYFENS